MHLENCIASAPHTRHGEGHCALKPRLEHHSRSFDGHMKLDIRVSGGKQDLDTDFRTSFADIPVVILYQDLLDI